jgi:hypothetical protein
MTRQARSVSFRQFKVGAVTVGDLLQTASDLIKMTDRVPSLLVIYRTTDGSMGAISFELHLAKLSA